MKITIISQNVQGLNDPNKLNIVKNYFRPYLPSVDFLCFQEHKLRGSSVDTLKSKIWPKASFFYLDAAVGNQAQAGCGGICTWVSPKLSHLVSISGYSRCGRAQWIRLSGVPSPEYPFSTSMLPTQLERDANFGKT